MPSAGPLINLDPRPLSKLYQSLPFPVAYTIFDEMACEPNRRSSYDGRRTGLKLSTALTDVIEESFGRPDARTVTFSATSSVSE
jgi:hypothetical protein